jgi:hypothetical protein
MCQIPENQPSLPARPSLTSPHDTPTAEMGTSHLSGLSPATAAAAKQPLLLQLQLLVLILTVCGALLQPRLLVLF